MPEQPPIIHELPIPEQPERLALPELVPAPAAPPRHLPWSTVREFAEEEGYTNPVGMYDTLFRGLRPEQLRYDNVVLRKIVTDMWFQPPNRLTREHTIFLPAARALMHRLVVVRGYKLEKNHSSFLTVGETHLSLYADYLNHTLRLEGEHQLPLRPRPPARESAPSDHT